MPHGIRGRLRSLSARPVTPRLYLLAPVSRSGTPDLQHRQHFELDIRTYLYEYAVREEHGAAPEA